MKSLNAPDIQIHTHMLQGKEDTRAMRKLNWIQFNSFTSHFLLFIYSILYFCHCVGYNSNPQQLFDFVWYVSIVSFHLAVFRFFYFPYSLVRWELCFLQSEKKGFYPNQFKQAKHFYMPSLFNPILYILMASSFSSKMIPFTKITSKITYLNKKRCSKHFSELFGNFLSFECLNYFICSHLVESLDPVRLSLFINSSV